MFKAIAEISGNLLAGGLTVLRDKINEMIRVVNSTQQISGDQFIKVEHAHGSGGLSLGLNINQVLSRIPKQNFDGYIVRVTAYDAGKGYYVGYVQLRKDSGFSSGAPSDFSDDVDLEMSDYYVDSSSVVVINDAESGTPLRALLANGTEYVECFAAGNASDALDPLPTPCLRCYVPFKAGSIVCRIDHKVGSGGVYTGPALFGSATATSSSNAVLPNGMTVGTVQCIIINIEESGQTGWRLPVGGSNSPVYALGTFVGMSSDSTPVPIIMIRGALGDLNSILDLPAGTFTTPDPNSWDWNTSAQAMTVHPFTNWGYDGSASAIASNVSSGGSHKIWMRKRMVTVDARGVMRKTASEGSTGTDVYIQLQAVNVVVDVALDGSGNLTKTKQNVYVVDFDAAGSPIIVVNHC